MAGSNHHIIPRHLQKGFASRIKGEKVWTWLYLKALDPAVVTIKEVSTRNVGNSDHFFGRVGEPNADPIMTNLENSLYTPLLDRLRIKSNTCGFCIVEEPLISEYICHLFIRTENFRTSYHLSTDYCLSMIEKDFSDFSKVKNFLINSPAISEKDIPLKLIFASNPNILDSEESKIMTLFKNNFHSIKTMLPQMVKESHNKLLLNLCHLQVTSDYCRRMSWVIYTFNRPSLILGDCGCLCQIYGISDYKRFDGTTKKLKRIFLPVAADKLLIGSICGTPEFNIDKLNQAMAKCSQYYFIFSENSEDMAKLVSLIGTELWIFSQVILDQIVSLILQSY